MAPRGQLLCSPQLHSCVTYVLLLLRLPQALEGLPNSEDELDVLFETYRVRDEAVPARGRIISKPSLERLDLATSILWFHTHETSPQWAMGQPPPRTPGPCPGMLGTSPERRRSRPGAPRSTRVTMTPLPRRRHPRTRIPAAQVTRGRALCHRLGPCQPGSTRPPGLTLWLHSRPKSKLLLALRAAGLAPMC